MNKLILSLILFAVPFLTQAKDSVSPVRARMQAFVNDKIISGSVTAIATKDKILSQETVGYADLKTKEAMRADHFVLDCQHDQAHGSSVRASITGGRQAVD